MTDKDDLMQTAFTVPKPAKWAKDKTGDKLFDMLQQKLAGIEIALIHIEEIMERSVRV